MTDDHKKPIPNESADTEDQSSQTQGDDNTTQDDSQTEPLQEKINRLQKEDELKKQADKALDDLNEITKMKKELADVKNQLDQLREISKRALADLENFRRRTEEDKKNFAKFANASLISELLPILDNFKRAVNHLPEELKDNEWTKGIQNIEKQFLNTLEKQGLKEMEALNQEFDPNLHEAMLQGPGEKDKIIEVLEPGYTLNDKILKPAKVKVGNGE